MRTSKPPEASPTHPETVEAMLAYPKQHPALQRSGKQSFDEFLNSYIGDPELRRILSSLSGYLTDELTKVSVAEMAPIFGLLLRRRALPARFESSLRRCTRRVTHGEWWHAQLEHSSETNRHRTRAASRASNCPRETFCAPPSSFPTSI